MIIEYLSASRLNVYVDCPFRYFLQYHLKLPELNQDTIHTHKGSAVHEVLEKYAKDDKDYRKNLIEYYFQHKVWEFDNRKPNRGFPHPVEKDCDNCKWATDTGGTKLCSVANRLVTMFDGCPKPNFEDDLALIEKTINAEDSYLSKNILGAEVAFSKEYEGFKVRGFIDLIIELDKDTIEVVDYKSGNYTKNTKDAFKDLQMRVYSLVAKELYPQYKYALMTLAYLRKAPVTVTFSPSDDLKTKNFLREAYQKIANSCDPPRKKSFKCNWCVGYHVCGKMKDSYRDDTGKFILPEASKAERRPRKLPAA